MRPKLISYALSWLLIFASQNVCAQSGAFNSAGIGISSSGAASNTLSAPTGTQPLISSGRSAGAQSNPASSPMRGAATPTERMSNDPSWTHSSPEINSAEQSAVFAPSRAAQLPRENVGNASFVAQ